MAEDLEEDEHLAIQRAARSLILSEQMAEEILTDKQQVFRRKHVHFLLTFSFKDC